MVPIVTLFVCQTNWSTTSFITVVIIKDIPTNIDLVLVMNILRWKCNSKFGNIRFYAAHFIKWLVKAHNWIVNMTMNYTQIINPCNLYN